MPSLLPHPVGARQSAASLSAETCTVSTGLVLSTTATQRPTDAATRDTAINATSVARLLAVAAIGVEPFVDHTVAILVVVAVADFLRDLTTVAACVRNAFIDLGIAIVVPAIADLLRHLAALTAGVGDPLVDLGVAVVILAVANLLGQRTTFAAGIALDTLIGSAVAIIVVAITDFVGLSAACTATIENVLVGLPVAVVVAAVADLVGLTTAFAAAVQLAFVDLAIAVVIKPVAFVAGLTAASAATVEHAIVDGAVAVVVESVADLGLRLARTGVATLAAIIGAYEDPIRRAFAPALGAGLTEVVAFVGGVVAVVIQPVAGLIAGCDVALAATPTVGPSAALLARSADSAVGRIVGSGVAAAYLDAVIDGAVAVVIEPVADLARFGQHLIVAGAPAVHAAASFRGAIFGAADADTNANQAHIGVIAGSVDAFVPRTVTILIDAVADRIGNLILVDPEAHIEFSVRIAAAIAGADQRGDSTGAIGAGAAAGVGTLRVISIRLARVALIDAAIAVVIDLIAPFARTGMHLGVVIAAVGLGVVAIAIGVSGAGGIPAITVLIHPVSASLRRARVDASVAVDAIGSALIHVDEAVCVAVLVGRWAAFIDVVVAVVIDLIAPFRRAGKDAGFQIVAVERAAIQFAVAVAFGGRIVDRAQVAITVQII